MSDPRDEERALNLASQAVDSATAGRIEDASRALREAASLAPDSDTVKAAFVKIQSEESIHILQRLCGRYILERDENAGKEALNYLERAGEVPGHVAHDCVELLINERRVSSKELQDGIVAGLLRESNAAKALLAKKLKEGMTATFEQVYGIGDRSANCIADVVLKPPAWGGESDRIDCERGVFQLFLAKLLEVGHDHDGRALKGITRLLASDANKLYTIIDEEIFDPILCSLDYRQPVEVRSQATLVVAKYLELSGTQGQEYLSKFIRLHIAKGHNEDLVFAFSAAAASFPIVPTMASTLFLTEGFLPSLIPLLDKKIKSDKVEKAALDMLSAACIDSACRDAIKKYCMQWLNQVMTSSNDDRPGLAAVILAKILDPTKSADAKVERPQGQRPDVNDLVPMFKKLLSDKSEASKRSSIEGLAYASVQSKVKEELVDDRLFLARLMDALKSSSSGATTIFGGLTLIDHLTQYPPVLSEEQKRMAQLKAYANAFKDSQDHDPLEENEAIARRCRAVLNAGTVTTLVGISSHLSPASTILTCNILLSLSKVSAHRGTIAQQGGAKLLLLKYTSITGTSPSDTQARRTVAHALARILISVNPILVFPSSGSPPLSSTIRPLLSLLTESENQSSDEPRDLLPTFEALLALTNLAGEPSCGAAEAIIRQALPTVEDLLLNKNTMIQRATTELVCNLMTCSVGVEIFADESKAASRRLHILLALADVEENATRKAAGGALATLTDFEGAVKEILGRERGLEILLGLCSDVDHEIVHRGIVCINNIVNMKGETGEAARKKIRGIDGVSILKGILRASKSHVILTLGRDALASLEK
ncbi:MAG: hypothetical protein Q9214_001846 [Letrouitia sp. 1 TL-2023]